MSSVDILFDINNKYILLIKRAKEPYKGEWALPGAVQNPFESFENAVVRLLKQRLNIALKISHKANSTILTFPQIDKDATLHQIKTYDSGTDPRGSNTTLFAVQINVDKEKLMRAVSKGLNVDDIQIFDKNKLPKLAFDHLGFINEYYTHLKPFTENAQTYDSARYEKPSVSVDMIIMTIKENKLHVLLIKRKNWPFENCLAIPGGFVQMDESLDDAARRELEEETGLKDYYLEQLYTFGAVNRDPRTRVITVSYYALISSKDVHPKAASDASDVAWFDVNKLPKLAFDHNTIIKTALERIRSKIEYTNIVFQLLGDRFTLSELQKTYEIILDTPLDKRNFRKKVKEVGLVKPLKEMRMDGAHRPAQLFTFKKDVSETILKPEKTIRR